MRILKKGLICPLEHNYDRISIKSPIRQSCNTYFNLRVFIAVPKFL